MLHYFIFGKEKYEKVCVVTAARSEYGLLRWLLKGATKFLFSPITVVGNRFTFIFRIWIYLPGNKR